MTKREQFKTSAENRPSQDDARDQAFEMFFESAWRRGDCIEDEKPAMLRAWNAAIASQSASKENRGICPVCNGSGFADATGVHTCFKRDGDGAENRPAQDDVRDAQRYRWLRDEGEAQWSIVNCNAGEYLDAAIDAALAQEKRGE